MFKTLYRCPRTISRHENGPLCKTKRVWVIPSLTHTNSPSCGPPLGRCGNSSFPSRKAFTTAPAEPTRRKDWNKNRMLFCTCWSGSKSTWPCAS